MSQIPVQQTDRGEDIRYFMGLVKLDEVAPGLKPGMTARVHIALTSRPHVLAIPHQAVQSDHGHKICYVSHNDNLERRELKIGQDTSEMIEITDGLVEGELVALNPPIVDGHVEPLVNFDTMEDDLPPSATTVTAAKH